MLAGPMPEWDREVVCTMVVAIAPGKCFETVGAFDATELSGARKRQSNIC